MLFARNSKKLVVVSCNPCDFLIDHGAMISVDKHIRLVFTVTCLKTDFFVVLECVWIFFPGLIVVPFLIGMSMHQKFFGGFKPADGHGFRTVTRAPSAELLS